MCRAASSSTTIDLYSSVACLYAIKVEPEPDTLYGASRTVVTPASATCLAVSSPGIKKREYDVPADGVEREPSTPR